MSENGSKSMKIPFEFYLDAFNYLDDASQTHLLRRSAPCVGWGQPRGLLLGLADGEIHWKIDESVNDDETSTIIDENDGTCV